MKVLLSALLSITALSPALAVLTVSNTSGTFTIDFDTTVAGVNNGQFAGTGFTPTPAAGQLDSDAWAATGLSDGALAFGGTQTAGDFAQGADGDGVGTGGIYAFQVGGTSDVALGVQPIGSDFTPGDLTLKMRNTSGTTIASFELAYEIWVLNNEDRSNSFNFSYSTDGSSYIQVGALDFTSTAAEDLTPAWTQNDRSTTLSSLNWLNGGDLFLRWTGDDVGGSGSRDEFGLDDIQVSSISAGVIPEPSRIVLLGLGALSLLQRRRR